MSGNRKTLIALAFLLILPGCGGDIERLQADGTLTAARLDSVIAVPRGVYVEGRATIMAPADSVWAVFSDFNRWRDYSSGFVRAQTAEGDALEWGLHFSQTYSVSPLEVAAQSVVVRMVPGREAVWKSTFTGLQMLQAVSLHPSGDRQTEVVCRERLVGLLALLFRDRLRAEAQEVTRTLLDGLRTACESRYPETGPSAPPSPAPPAAPPWSSSADLPQIPSDTTARDSVPSGRDR